MDNLPNLPNNNTSTTVTPPLLRQSFNEGGPHKVLNHWVVVIITILAVLGYFISSYAFSLWPFEVKILPIVKNCGPDEVWMDIDPVQSSGPHGFCVSKNYQTNPTADWQTYRNYEYGFEVKYPENWYQINQQNNRVILSNVSIFSQLSEESLASEARFEINITDKNVVTTIEQWFDTRYKDLDYNSKEIIALGDNKALKVEVFEIGKRIHIYTISSTMVIELVYPVQVKFQDIYDQILSTFRFIDSQ